MSRRQRTHKRVISEINVVPYIDVMLVLLVIFMITAPLINRGVEVDLPEADAEALGPSGQEPLVLSVDRDGGYYLNRSDDPTAPMTPANVFARAAALLRLNPGLPVLVKADKEVDYGEVVRAMVLLQQAGADKVGLSTRIPESLER
jgi:biopolymer transport protein TolR